MHNVRGRFDSLGRYCARSLRRGEGRSGRFSVLPDFEPGDVERW